MGLDKHMDNLHDGNGSYDDWMILAFALVLVLIVVVAGCGICIVISCLFGIFARYIDKCAGNRVKDRERDIYFEHEDNFENIQI